MPHCQTYVRRLLRKLPSDPAELLERRKYRDPNFLQLFLDHVGDLLYRDLPTGVKYAQVVPRLARLVPEGDEPAEKRQHCEALVKARALCAGAHRIVGRNADAESEYALAFGIADAGPVSPIARADLCHRLAVLRAVQKRFAEAHGLASSAVVVCRGVFEGCQELAETLALSEALATLGYVLNEAERFAEAIPIHGEALRLAGRALRLAGRRHRSPAAVRVHRAVRVNLAYALTETSPSRASTVISLMQAAFRGLRGLRRCRERHHCQWIEGKAWLRFGMEQRGMQSLKVARRGFLKLGAPWEIATVSLDLALLHRSSGQWKELEDLAEDTLNNFCELCGDFETITALSLWLEAVQERSGVQAAIDHTRRTIEKRMPR